MKDKLATDNALSRRASMEEVENKDSPGCNITRARHSEGGMVEPPTREVVNHKSCVKTCPTNIINQVPTPSTVMPVCIISKDAPEMSMDQVAEIPIDELANNMANIFTHMSDPFKTAC